MGSVLWWLLYRRLKTVYVLSLPFAFYGLAFLLIGLAPLGASVGSRGWIQNVATGFYAIASASGSVYFAVNFGDEGKPTRPLLFNPRLHHFRGCARNILGLPSLRYPGHAADLCRGTVVLGIRIDERLTAYLHWQQCSSCEPRGNYSYRRGHCMLDVGGRHCAPDRPTAVLPSSAWLYSFFLHLLV